MKAYVIKNKEGKYLNDYNCETNSLIFAEVYNNPFIVSENMEKEGWKPQTITISEGDLEEEIGILKGFAYKLFREKYDDIPEKIVREWFDDALKDTRNFIQQAKEDT